MNTLGNYLISADYAHLTELASKLPHANSALNRVLKTSRNVSDQYELQLLKVAKVIVAMGEEASKVFPKKVVNAAWLAHMINGFLTQ